MILTAAAILALGVPVGATAGNGNGKAHTFSTSYVAPDLKDKAKSHPNDQVKVIIQSTAGTLDAVAKVKGLGPLAHFGRKLDLVKGVTATLPAKLVAKLADVPGISVVPDAPVKLDGNYSRQMWPYVDGSAYMWNYGPQPGTIAIVDSGIDANRADFSNGARVLASVNLSTLDPNATGDDRGHGTFVAGIAAGSAYGYAGAAPRANLVSVKVMDSTGMALTSDVIAGANWVLQNKDTYNIEVANFSLHSTYPSNFGHDPLDQAVEKLWFSGITVVAAAGNYGNADGTPSGVHYAPGNDPFVITVGAVDLGASASRSYDDSIAPWSAYGYTYDGFWKPEISAAGRYLIGPVPQDSSLPAERPDHVKAPGYMQLSGTSFSAPVIAGVAAQLMARHPGWGPDQVKGALMLSAARVPLAAQGQAGVGQVNAVRANRVWSAPNPNAGLERFVTADPADGTPVFDAISWYDAAQSDISWNSISWSDISWSDISWSDISWSDISWNDISWSDISWSSISWSDISWSDISWNDISWNDSSKEDAVLADAASTDPLATDAAAVSDITANPTLVVDDPTLDYSVLDDVVAATDTTSATATP